jgi:hypothetical protein
VGLRESVCVPGEISRLPCEKKASGRRILVHVVACGIGELGSEALDDHCS